jgi:hypothetical protein
MALASRVEIGGLRSSSGDDEEARGRRCSRRISGVVELPLQLALVLEIPLRCRRVISWLRLNRIDRILISIRYTFFSEAHLKKKLQIKRAWPKAIFDAPI